jgi:putative ABC transport system substrate-binding protein
MTRRLIGLIITLALGFLLAPFATAAQPVGKVARIGWLLPFPRFPQSLVRQFFRQVMAELGWVEGQNMQIEDRWADLQYDRLPALAAELVQLQPDVLIGHTTLATQALKQATTTIPIVMIFVDDAVHDGLVASLAHPGGNVTGVSSRYTELIPKRLELLRETVPHLSRLAVLFNPIFPMNASAVQAMHVVAHALGVTLQFLEVRDPDALEDAFAAMTRAHADALFILNDPLVVAYRKQIADLAVRSRLPTGCDDRPQADAGCLMSYGVDWRDVLRHAASYVDKILKGAKPADLPVEQPIRFELVINLKTAQALDLTLPPMLLFQANEVIR